MFTKTLQYSIGLLLMFVGIALSAILLFWWRDFEDTKVTFFDVGQGDAILISQGSNQVLIDGGRSGKVALEKLGGAIPFWDHHIETVVATHPDEDHIGGLVDVFGTYQVGTFLDTKMKSDTSTYQALQEVVSARHIVNIETLSGLTLHFPDGGMAEVLYPFVSFENTQSKDTNTTSIVIKLTTASGATFLFTGDLPDEQELQIDSGKVDVLKAGHHGSKHSSSNEFLDITSPTDVVLSVGVQNRYGHPAPETLERLRNHHARIFRTDIQGNIVYRCPPKKDHDCVVSIGKD